MKLSELLSHLPEHEIPSGLSVEIDLLPTVNQEEICEKSLLFIYKRVGGDYNIAPEELKSHPYAIVTDREYPITTDTPIIYTDNVRSSLAYAFFIESRFDPTKIKLIGITGTNGKTTTSTIIHKTLNLSGVRCGYIGTGIIRVGVEDIADENYSMTTPDPEMLYENMKRMQDEGCDVIVMEVSSHSIALEKVAPLNFDIGAFTNLSSEHLDFHTDMEDYFRTKMRLFERCRIGIFNIDDAYGKRGYSEVKCNKRSIGVIWRGDIYCTDITQHGLTGSEFYYRDEKRIFKLRTPLGGSYNVYNTAMAAAILIELGMPACIVKKRLGEIRRIPGRLEVIRSSPTVIIDYAHTPLSLQNVLKTIRTSINSRQKLIAVFGCGGNRDKSKRAMMGEIAKKYADRIILTEDNSRNESTSAIIKDILSGIKDTEMVTVIHSREEAIVYALSIATPNDVIAIIGKGHEKYIIDADGYRKFDEVEIINKFYEDENNENAN